MLRIVSFSLVVSSLLSAEVDWRFAHPGADMLLGLNLRRIAESPAGDMLRQSLGKTGLDPSRRQMLETIEEVYVSVRTKYVKGRPAGEPLGVILVRGNFDQPAALKMLSQQPQLAWRLIDRRTLLLGDEESMAGAVERMKGDDGLEAPVLARAKELAEANDFWIVGSPAPLNRMKPRGSMKKQGGMLGDIEEVFDNLRSFSLGIAVRDNIALDLGLNLRTKAAADQLMALYQRLEADMQKTPEGQAQWAKLSQSLEVHPNGTAVRFAMRAPMPDVQQTLAQVWGARMAGTMLASAPVTPAPAVAAPLPVAAPAPAPVPVRRTVRIYGQETGYREIPTTPR